mgnify:CR=1 FL=1
MELRIGPRELLQIDNARIVFRNFEGRADKYNREGDRNFAVVIPSRDLTMDEVNSIMDIYREAELVKTEDGEVLMYKNDEIITLADALTAFGWNVKVKEPREEGDDPFIYMTVKIKFNERGPKVYLKTGDKVNPLDEESVGLFDNIDIASVDMDLRPFDWDVNGKTGRTAYLQSICVTQAITDRFAARYSRDEEEIPFN